MGGDRRTRGKFNPRLSAECCTNSSHVRSDVGLPSWTRTLHFGDGRSASLRSDSAPPPPTSTEVIGFRIAAKYVLPMHLLFSLQFNTCLSPMKLVAKRITVHLSAGFAEIQGMMGVSSSNCSFSHLRRAFAASRDFCFWASFLLLFTGKISRNALEMLLVHSSVLRIWQVRKNPYS